MNDPMHEDKLCVCGHIELCHKQRKERTTFALPYCMGPTGYAFGAFSYGCSCEEFIEKEEQ